MYIDSHTHLSHERFNKDREAVLAGMTEQGITRFIENPIGLESNALMREKLRGISGVYFAAGIHPTRLPDFSEKLFAQIRQFAQMQDTVAVGEVGLDHHILGSEHTWGLQEEWFHSFLELAKETEKPLILHIRQASEEGLRILREHGASYQGVVHCFHEGWKTAEQYLELGFHLGIGGKATKELPEFHEAIKYMPLDRILLETDSPFVTPDPFTGRNTPQLLPVIAEAVAKIKGIDAEIVRRTAVQNTEQLFQIET